MNKLLVGLFLSIGLVNAAQAAGDVNAGKAKAAVCASCHGADGNSMVASFPKLAGQNERYLVKQMRDIKTGKRTVAEMTGLMDNLSEQDLADIGAFFASKPIIASGAKPELVELGSKVFRAGAASKKVPACTGCHSPTGQGNSLAGFPALGGQHAAYLEKQLKAFRTGADDPQNAAVRDNDDNSTMRSVAAHLSDKEIEAVSSFLAGLRP